MAHEFSEAGRKARFERWEQLGPDRVRSDLERDPYRLIGSGDVQNLAWEWLRKVEAEQRLREKDQEAALALGRLYPQSTDWAAQPPPQQPEAPHPAAAEPPTSVIEPRPELFTLKPTIYGVGVDLKEVGRRIRRRFQKS